MKIRIYAYSDRYFKWLTCAPSFYLNESGIISDINKIADAMLSARFNG